jgi:PKD repeat protein
MDVESATRAETRQRGTARAIPQRGKRGQSLVEFALILPLLMLLLLLVVDFGRAYMGWVELNNAARVAANYAAQNPTGPFGTAYASLVSTDATGSNCPLPSPIPAPTFPNGTQLGAQAQVTLTCQFHLIVSAFPGFGQLLPNPATLSATAYFPVRTGSTPVVPPTCPNGTGPTATITASPPSGSAPLPVTVTFAITSTGSPTSYSVDYGDGSTVSGNSAPPPTLTHTYTSADQPNGFSSSTGLPNSVGPYTVVLTVSNGCSSIASTTVDISGLTAWFAWSPGTPTAGQAVAFTDESFTSSGAGTTLGPSNASSWSWTFGDPNATGSNNTSTVQDPSHTYSLPGIYTVTLTVSNGTATATTSQPIQVAGCTVPGLGGLAVTAAQAAWTDAGFTSNLVINGTGQYVATQSVPSGTLDTTCARSMTVTTTSTP